MMLSVVGAIAMICLIVAPLLYEQIQWLIASMAGVIAQHNGFMSMNKYGYDITSVMEIVRSYWATALQHMFSAIGNIAPSIISSGVAIFNVLAIICITPVVLYYVLVSWPDMVLSLKDMLPLKARKTCFMLMAEVDAILAAYVRGQGVVCLIMGSYYSISLWLIGMEHAIALGFVAGAMTFIPYVGVMFSMLIGVTMASAQYGTMLAVLKVMGAFLLGQFLEGNVVVPRFLGNTLHLHPVWVMFGLLAGGAAFGFIGVLIALPLTAVLAVFIKYSIQQYKKSEMYK
jgi:predicted PurR-regulated permease PerM